MGHAPAPLVPPAPSGPVIRRLLRRDRLPVTFLILGASALVIQLHRPWRDLLVYDRSEIAQGQWWRIWTGQLVHFGWPHFVADTGLFLILGRLLEWEWPKLCRLGLLAMPVAISATLYCFDPTLVRYGGLSAVNLGFLVFLACLGWQRNWVDWFWPAVLALYVGEIILEATVGHGHGGGMIQFDDRAVQVATVAHVGAAACGLALWAAAALGRRRRPLPASQQ